MKTVDRTVPAATRKYLSRMNRPEVKKVSELCESYDGYGKFATPLSDTVDSFTDEFIFFGIYN